MKKMDDGIEVEMTAEDIAWAEEQEAIWLEQKKKTGYIRKRLMEYPPIGDQLDALYHAGVFPAEMADKLKAVKDKYPKGAS